MDWEFDILYAIQSIRTPFLDKVMAFLSTIGDAGVLWICLLYTSIPAGPSNLGMQTTLSENMEDDMERVSLAKELSSTTSVSYTHLMQLKRQKKKVFSCLCLKQHSLQRRDMVKSATSCGIFMQVKKSEENDLSHHADIQMRRQIDVYKRQLLLFRQIVKRRSRLKFKANSDRQRMH